MSDLQSHVQPLPANEPMAVTPAAASATRNAPERSSEPAARHVAFFLRNLAGGGVERTTLLLAGAFVARGLEVDLVLCRKDGALRDQIPQGVRTIELRSSPGWRARLFALAADRKGLGAPLRAILLSRKLHKTVPYLPALVRYLRERAPLALLAAMPPENLQAVWARRLAAVPTRVLVSERNMLSLAVRTSGNWRDRFLPRLIGRTYVAADAIIAVSDGVADDLASLAGIPRDRIDTVYNPVVTPEIQARAREPVAHPWFAPGAPPVVLGVGRLVAQKDFPTLLRAFAHLRREREARLIILGEARNAEITEERRAELLELADRLGIADDVDLPGFVDNPFAYMAKAAVFVLSSAWEGLPGVLIQALACGCPVVSTDCPSGPAEILDGGGYGALVPVGDDRALAEAILQTLNSPRTPDRLRARAQMFAVDRAVERYLELLLGETVASEEGRATAR